MARKPMVTRTIKATNVTLMVVDTESAEVGNHTLTLPRTYKDNKEIMKMVAPMFEDSTIKPVAVVDAEIVTARYGMLETDFIQYAHIMTPAEEEEVAENE